MDGYQSASNIRDFEELNGIEPPVCIIGVSGDTSKEHERRCRQVQINESLAKPVTRNDMEHLSLIHI